MVFTHAVDYLEDFFLSIGPGDEPKFPHVPATLRSVWYLTPRQHAMETVCYVMIFAPMCYVALKQALNHSKWKNQRPIRAPTALDGVLGAITMSSFLGVCYYKAHSVNGWRLLYMFQPCHVMTFTLAILCIARGRTANFIFQVYVAMTWSSDCALAFPDTSDYIYIGDIYNFYIEHYLMLVIPVLLCVSGRYEYIGSPSWILFGFTVIALYHAIVLQLACLVTEVNIATLMSPPNVLRSLGEWYRPAQYGMCFVLHWVHNLSITGFVAIASSSKVLKPLLSPKQH
ncbi:hypothetical protein H257_04993 [Aphanomyces astaci]|uniref:Uncharacterized protein n=1 Tax=Aphanomyces astaci TaxID=112090 RepID=W4GSK8_APHAT|nr:hypothetical protein H257_04993 [Aphanomyces astaci]ETV82316.1 hypothetical protein H257_04993 [Aphanomyces astaci]|eukprot:XP_009827985.1 hypothetical protein H257_04993 [Aphanomyces astaci]